MNDSEKIAALEAEVSRLKAALEAIVDENRTSSDYPVTNAQIAMYELACKALGIQD